MIDWKGKTTIKEVIIHEQNVTAADLNDSELPTDIHIVEYENEGKYYSDAVRAPKMSDIFDAYYDKLKTTGGKIISITSGFGRIKPKLYNPPKAEDKK